MKPIQIIAEIGKVETQTDGLKMVVYTNEASNEDLALLIGSRGKQGMMLFKAEDVSEFSEGDIKDIPEVKMDINSKSPSERLRAIIWQIWNHNTNQKQAFPSYYLDYMDRLCESLKEKIQP